MQYPSIEDQKRYAACEATPIEHERLFHCIGALQEVEVQTPELPLSASLPVRILFWNMERGRYPNRASALLKKYDPMVVLLAEMDIGMARTDQRNTIADLALRMRAGYLFATEFVELAIGDESEQAAKGGAENRCGLHGNGIVSPLGLSETRRIRLERSGRWFFAPWQGQRRIGGRVAVAAKTMIGDTPLILVSVHIESHSNPAERAAETAVLMHALDDAYGTEAPVLIGGDFNTNTIGNRDGEGDDFEARHHLAAEEPGRFRHPESHEPLFDVAMQRGYDWLGCNAAGIATQRRKPGAPAPPLGKLDWFFSRHLEVSDPEVIPAVDAQGAILSDHDIIAVTITSMGTSS
jgi:endonuclease/exonuclease/phosphatase family metal-dependent hydrolase